MTDTARLANARTITVNKTTVAGATLMIASPQSMGPDCNTLGTVEAKVMTQPAHGTIQIMPGAAFPNYQPGDRSFACNRVKRPATMISYTAFSDFTGQDTAAIQIFFPDGAAPTIVANITVR